MKVWLAESELNDNYYVVGQDGKNTGIFLMELTGLFGNMLYDSAGFYDGLSTDDKLLFVEKLEALLEDLEGEHKRLNDIKIESKSFDIPEWLLLYDWQNDESDIVINTKMQSTFKFIYAGEKIIAEYVNANTYCCERAMSFVKRMISKS